MTEQAKEARRQYRREWARKNPDKVKAQQERYWAKKAGFDPQKPAENAGKEVQAD